MPLAHDLKPDLSKVVEGVTPDKLIETLSKNYGAKVAKDKIYNKPKHWGYKSNAPYYRPMFGEVMKRVFDLLMETKAPQVYYYKDWPNVSHSTLYLRVVQGRNYLLDHMDPNGSYATLNQCITITRQKNVGILIALRADLVEFQMDKGNLENYMPKPLTTTGFGWKDKMEDWLNGDKALPFEVTGLVLSEEDQYDLHMQLDVLPDVAAKISERSIKLVKL